VALWALTSAAFSAIVVWKYAIFRNGVDLGIFTQVVASTGGSFSSTAEGGVNHLAVHWSPILVAGWPFVRLFGPLGLELLQALLAAATLFPLWGLARARFRPPVAFALVAVAALYPVLCANAVGDFHELAFVPFFSAALVWAADCRRFGLGLLAAFLLACVKEDQFFILMWNGGLLALFLRAEPAGRRFGLGVAGIGAASAALYFGVLHAWLGPHLALTAAHFYDWSQPNLSGPRPASLLWPRLAYLASILGPLAFVPCLSRYALFLVPGFAEALASHEPITLVAGAHYSANLTGYALAAFVDGAAVAALRSRIAGAAAAAAAAVASLAIAIWASPMEYWYYLYRLPDAHDALLARTLAALPPDASVGAEDEIFAHLGRDPNASIDANGQTWFVYDATHFSVRWHDVDEPAIRALVARGVYRVASSDDGIVVLHR